MKLGELTFSFMISAVSDRNQEYRDTQELKIFVTDSIEKPQVFEHKAEKSDTSDPVPETSDGFPAVLKKKYQSVELIGKGGFARVYKGTRNGKVYAIKIPSSLDETTGKTFINEIQNWTRLVHPNIVRVHDYNILPVPYFEMDFCKCSLGDIYLPVASDEAAWIIFNVCEGLRYAHGHSVIHQDIKPQNILLTSEGDIKITDWGLSRLVSSTSTTTTASFSPVYAAPEQITSKPKSAATDIWQVGVVFYELLTGNLPFGGESMVEIGMSIVQAEPVPPSEHNQDAKPFDTIILRCLEKDPKNRYQSVSALQKDLSEAMNGQYAHLLKQSVSTNDMKKSACYCGELVLINLTTGQLSSAYRYANDLVQYATGDVQEMAERIAAMIQLRIQEQTGETIPAELLQMVEMLVHNVRMGVR